MFSAISDTIKSPLLEIATFRRFFRATKRTEICVVHKNFLKSISETNQIINHSFIMLTQTSKIIFVLFLSALLSDTAMCRHLKTPKSTKGPTLKSSTKAPTLKSTKSPTLKSTKGPTAKSTKGPKSSKAPTTKSTKSSSKGGGGGGGTDVFVSIGAVNFDDLAEDAAVGTYEGLIWSNFKASATTPTPPSAPRGAVPTSSTATVELASGVFSLVSVDIAGAPPANPVTIKGFNSAGTQTVTRVVNFLTTYATYDLSEFANVAKIEFDFGVADASGLDNFVFL